MANKRWEDDRNERVVPTGYIWLMQCAHCGWRLPDFTAARNECESCGLHALHVMSERDHQGAGWHFPPSPKP